MALPHRLRKPRGQRREEDARIWRPDHVQGQVADETPNTPWSTCVHPSRSCYFYCMISPIRGDLTGFRVQVSETLNPHSLLFAGMQDRHPGPARGRGRALWLLSLPPSRDVVLVVSAALAYGDRRDTAAAGAKGPLVRVIG